MLPQLAVSAKILCLLMVMICGAVPSMVRSVRLYSQCSHMYVNVFQNGSVMARSVLDQHPNLIMRTLNQELDMLLYSPIHDMYICFNRSRVVGRRIRHHPERQSNCIFKEEFVPEGYNKYRLKGNTNRYLGFTPSGKPLRRGYSRLQNTPLQRCFHFLSDSHEFDITRHNLHVGGGNLRDFRRKNKFGGPRPPRQNSLSYPCLRSHQTRHRRKNCRGT